MYQHFIWDFDGTLYDTYGGMVGAFQAALREFNIIVRDDVVLAEMSISASHALRVFVERYRLSDAFVERYIANEAAIPVNAVNPFPFARELCELAPFNYIMTHRNETIFPFLRAHQMDHYFTDVITREHGFPRKPDPTAYLYLLETYKMKREEVLIIGDRTVEIDAARAIGVDCCLFNSNGIVHFNEPKYVVTNLEQLYLQLKGE